MLQYSPPQLTSSDPSLQSFLPSHCDSDGMHVLSLPQLKPEALHSKIQQKNKFHNANSIMPMIFT